MTQHEAQVYGDLETSRRHLERMWILPRLRRMAPPTLCGIVLASLDYGGALRAGYTASLSLTQVVASYIWGTLVLTGWAGVTATMLAGVYQGISQRSKRARRAQFYRYAIGAWTCVTIALAGIAYVPLWSSTAITSTSPVLFMVIGAGCFLGTLGGFLSRRIQVAIAIALLNASVGYWVLTHSLYIFSRYGVIKYIHSIGFLAYIALVTLLIEHALRRSTVMQVIHAKVSLLVYTGLVVLGSVGADYMGSASKLVLYERTALVYRGLALSPWPFGSFREAPYHGVACETGATTGQHKNLEVGTIPTARGILLVLIDSLRADRLDVERDGHPLMPRLREFRSRAANFNRAYANFPGTTWSVRGMATGMFAPAGLGEDEPGLGEILRRENVKTHAIIVHGNIKKALGEDIVYDTTLEESKLIAGKNAITSEQVAKRAFSAIARFRESGERFFVLAHFYDPHSHYVANDMANVGDSELERYNAEVHRTDSWIGWLLDSLGSNALRRDLAIIVVSDHGDEFWDHGYVRHQFRLYDESVRQVFMVRFSPITRGGWETTIPVSNVDLFPTVLNLYGIPAPTNRDGLNVMSLIGRERAVYMYNVGGEKLGIVARHHKLIVDQSLGTWEFYDLVKDPSEKVNHAERGGEILSGHFCLLRAWARREGLWWE